jgi:[acyl-carrier-protein] S-malonyltransferase
MLQAMAAEQAVVQETFVQAGRELGFDLWAMVQDGPAEVLGQTENTQPAMLTAGVALWRVWQRLSDVRPAYMAGHSLGEYTALVCAGAIDFEDAVGLVAERGRLMEQAVPSGLGTMAAIIGLDDESVKEVCVAAADGQVVEAVNFNAPGQVAIAGHADAVSRAMTLARERGARKAVQLPVSGPFHSSLMAEAAEALKTRLDQLDVRSPQITVLHNVDARSREDANAIRAALVAQLSSPVLWVGIVQAMTGAGVERMIECGPGKVLAGLGRRIDRGLETAPLFDAASLEKTLTLVTGRG